MADCQVSEPHQVHSGWPSSHGQIPTCYILQQKGTSPPPAFPRHFSHHITSLSSYRIPQRGAGCQEGAGYHSSCEIQKTRNFSAKNTSILTVSGNNTLSLYIPKYHKNRSFQEHSIKKQRFSRQIMYLNPAISTATAIRTNLSVSILDPLKTGLATDKTTKNKKFLG